MKREFLEGLGLEKEVIDKIMAENGNDINKEKEKLKIKEKELKVANEKLDEANRTIASYKDMDIDEIKQSAEDWKGKYEEAKEKMENIKNDATLTKALTEINTIDPELLKLTLDHEMLKYDDGKVIGLEEQIKSIKEAKPYLFKTEEGRENPPDPLGGLHPHVPPTPQGGANSDMAATINSIFDF
ncbi:MAG: phage scaffolding protein [Tissierellia bacterium]|nr:phage scaffolding protein [Tissierellia bacterium]